MSGINTTPVSSESNQGPSGRKLIICFDGTGQNEENKTNVALLYDALKGDGTSTTQLVHYEQGIGSAELTDSADIYGRDWDAHPTLLEGNQPSKRGPVSRVIKEPLKNSYVAKQLDKAFALSLKTHLVSAYTFLVNTYQNGDQIYIFGYSRGAYSARALAGMIYKVGLVPNGNKYLSDIAFELYKQADKDGWHKSELFKAEQKLSPEIEFLGLWDTVSSVGLRKNLLPFTKVASLINIKYIRHALCLDERRADFPPEIVTILPEQWEKAPEMKYSTAWGSIWKKVQEHTDVCEMWFPGYHSDVGGGNSEPTYSLSRIPLRWIVSECSQKAGLEFPRKWLTEIGFKLDKAEKPMFDESYTFHEGEVELAFRKLWGDHHRAHWMVSALRRWRGKHKAHDDGEATVPMTLLDALSPVHDETKKGLGWKVVGLGGLRDRDRAPKLPIKLHPAVKLREQAIMWAMDPQRDSNIRRYAKKLKLTTYASKLAQTSRDVEIEEEEHNALVAQFRASSLGSSVLGETGA